MVSIKVLSKTENEIKFILDKVDPAFANEIRREAAFEVPVMAIEDVYFKKNSSALYDEAMALRLGLIPFTTDLKGYNIPAKCVCRGKGCGRCQIKMTLKAKGPCIVYAKDIKVRAAPKVKPAYPDMPIVKLLENQEVEIEATAQLGQGKEHMKWAAGLAYYQHYPKINISQKDLKDPKIALEHCPRDVFELKGDKLAVKNLEACNLCKSCEDRTDKAVQVSGEEDKFIFTLESWGQLKPSQILAAASELIKEKLKEVKLK